MKQPILFVALFLALTATGAAQQKETPACTVRILLLNQNWNDHSQTRELMSPDQMKWWLEDGQKKFKNFCFVSASKPHDYKIVWTDQETSQTRYIPSTTTTSGSVQVEGKTGTYSEVSYGPPQRRTFATAWVQIRLFKADADLDSPALFNELHKGSWIWSKPDRAALENGLKALAKLTKTRK